MKRLVLSILLCFACSTLYASEIMPWITPTGVDGIEVETYFANSSRRIDFDVFTSIDYVSSPLMIKMSIRPGLGYSPYFKFGLLSSELRQYDIGRSTLIKKWSGAYNGFTFGGGAKYVINGDSVIMPQVFLDVGLAYFYSGLSEYNGISGINHSISVWEIHGALIGSKVLKVSKDFWITPYAGVNMLAETATWNAIDESVIYSGTGSSLHLIIGMEVSVKSFSVKAEGSLLDGFGIAAGFNYEFGY